MVQAASSLRQQGLGAEPVLVAGWHRDQGWWDRPCSIASVPPPPGLRFRERRLSMLGSGLPGGQRLGGQPGMTGGMCFPLTCSPILTPQNLRSTLQPGWGVLPPYFRKDPGNADGRRPCPLAAVLWASSAASTPWRRCELVAPPLFWEGQGMLSVLVTPEQGHFLP